MTPAFSPPAMLPACRRLARLLVLAAMAGAASGFAADKGAYTLFNPVPTALLREMSTDRPDTTESPMTVDAGHFQVEASLVDFSRDQSSGVTTESWVLGQVNLKAGLFECTDLQLVFDAYTRSRTTGMGSPSVASGISDLTIRLKQNLWGNEGDSTTACALMPWVSLPTGSAGISADRHQGGLIAMLSVELADGSALGMMIEGDVLWGGSDYYVEWTHTLTLGLDLTEALGLYVEYVGQNDSGPVANYRAYGDLGLTYGVTPNLIFDTGIRVGLNKRADDIGWFAGVSRRY